MNKNYKKTFAVLVALGALCGTNVWAVGGNGTAQENRADRQADIQQKKDDRIAEKNDNICEKISERADAFTQKMTEQENTFQTRNQERLANWTTKKTEKETELSANRTTWDANRDAQFEALEERAQTEEQKKATADFEATTRSAITTRRAASDSAIKTFQDGVQTAVNTRNGQVEKLLSDAKSARQALLETAKADCAAGKDAKTVMATFRSGMEANRAKVQADKQNVTKLNTQVEALIATRKTAMEKALTDFKATMEQARVILRKAFPADGATATTPVPVQ
jgi:hypothetical protein